jgi:Ser-tRNA(Ala) deacylase AlaX
MRAHIAAELILELVYKQLNPIEKIGAHISPGKSRIDFKWPENISPIFPVIKKEAQELIDANHEIISAFSDEENQRRYWEIKGFGRVPCGGTHLKKQEK